MKHNPSELRKLLEDHFDSTIKSRGQAYYREGLVRFESRTDSHFVYLVRGSEKYTVFLNLGSPKASTCTCPYFQGGYFCKHLWASLLMAERHGNLREDSAPQFKAQPSPPPPITWKDRVEKIIARPPLWQVAPSPKLPRESFYLIAANDRDLRLTLYFRELKANGKKGPLRPSPLTAKNLAFFDSSLDIEILHELFGDAQLFNPFQEFDSYAPKEIALRPQGQERILKKLISCQKLYYFSGHTKLENLTPINEYAGKFKPVIHIESTSLGQCQLQLKFISEKNEDLDVLQNYLGPRTYHFAEDRIYLCHDILSAFWRNFFANNNPFYLNRIELHEFIIFSMNSPDKISLSFAQNLEIKIEKNVPVGEVHINRVNYNDTFSVKLLCSYDGTLISNENESPYIVGDSDIIRERDFEIELILLDKFYEIVPENVYQSENQLIVPMALFETFTKSVSEHFKVFVDHRKYRLLEQIDIKQKSGQNWLDLNGQASFSGEHNIALPQLLRSLKKGQLIELPDGSVSLLPTHIFKDLEGLGNVSQISDDSVRLGHSQAFFWQLTTTETSVLKNNQLSAHSIKILKKLLSPPLKTVSKSFKGTLRDYQKQGVGWLQILRAQNLGGILADDMGLGKTIQVLAHFASLKLSKHPHLIVAPKSLLENWRNEINKFTPHLKTLLLTGTTRSQNFSKIQDFDVVLITYQSLLRDSVHFENISFDTVVYDEAHNVKNALTKSYNSCQGLSSRHRILLSGTPIENSLEDLKSLLNLANPGLLKKTAAYDPEKLFKGIRPFILRRTKAEVLKDLPEKSEQIIYCEMSEKQKLHYEQVKNYYRSAIQSKIALNGFAKSKIYILEALLRLRQVAISTELLENTNGNRNDLSCKFEVLLEMLTTIASEGHKVLVFSQFTSALKIFRGHLETKGLASSYLDGSSKNRLELVEEFQTSKTKNVFLLSLKAGGVGLNITSASYVFILDPWWNPAAEAQAIDRAHRIGQKNKVMAYKLITKETVEEKILELQNSKKSLVNKLFEGNSEGLLKNISLEDLNYLFDA